MFLPQGMREGPWPYLETHESRDIRANCFELLSSPLIFSIPCNQNSRLKQLCWSQCQGYAANLLPPESIPWKQYNHMDYFVAVPGNTPRLPLVIDDEENMKAVVAGAKKNKVSISIVSSILTLSIVMSSISFIPHVKRWSWL